MKKLNIIVAGLLLVPVLAIGTVATFSGDVASAQITRGLEDTGQDSSGASVGPELIAQVINWMLYAVGVIAVIMLIWGGVMYSTSGGDSTKVTNAKNTILYAIIGLLVAIFAYAIVQFVVSKTTGQ
ncbi:hypothetical protein CR969_02120 [Candidatus Saccharibacteria bacterium]|nr:MAG: hypothetical protein CR969_02120 [Candidatus Saccharibacteria bacterium]